VKRTAGMGLVDCVVILVASLGSAVLAEVLSWLLIYRTESYNNLRDKVERLNKKLSKLKDQPVNVDKKKSREKRTSQYEQQLQDVNRDLNMNKMKSVFAVGVAMISLFGVLNGQYGGVVVAKLPFESISLVRTVSHRGLLGNDFTDCSMAFLYALCSMSLRTSLQKFFGWTPPVSQAGGGFFGAPQ